MDAFMDKLAHKLTAQEMIKANSAADAEEMNKLKSTLEEYNECLEKMQKLIEDGVNKLDNARVDCGEVTRLAEESISRINDIQRESEELKRLINDKLEGIRVDSGEINRLVEVGITRINNVQRDTEVRMNDQVQTLLEDLKSKLAEKPDNLEELKTLLGEKQEASNEHVHKESVKVYRNVQAVVVEENAKLTEAINTSLNDMGGKLNKINNFAIIALVLAAGSLAIQILNLLGIKFF